MKTGTTFFPLSPSLSSAWAMTWSSAGADVGAMGEAEEDEHIAPVDVRVGDGLPVGADQREWSADERSARRLNRLPAMRGGEEQDRCPGECADQEASDDESDQAGAHLLSELHKRAVDLRALQEPAEG